MKTIDIIFEVGISLLALTFIVSNIVDYVKVRKHEKNGESLIYDNKTRKWKWCKINEK